MRRHQKRKQWLISGHDLVLLCGVIFSVFCMIALGTHRNVTEHEESKNWCGLVGLSLAQGLFFLLGTAAYGIPLCMGSICLRAGRMYDFMYVWERMCALVCIVPLSAALCTLCNYSYGWNISGGVAGSTIVSILSACVDRTGCWLLLPAGLIACWIIITQVSLLDFVGGTQRTIRAVYLFNGKYRILQRSYYMGKYCILISGFPIVWLISFIRRAYQGSLCEQTTFIIPEDAYEDTYDTEKNISYMATTADRKKNEDLPLENIAYRTPDITLLSYHSIDRAEGDAKKDLELRAQLLVEKLQCFGIKGSIVAIRRGPVVTLFEYQPEIDTKISKIVALEDDLALALQALSIRIIAPIPGRAVVGFEVANYVRRDVLFARVMHHAYPTLSAYILPLLLGEDTTGNGVVIDLAYMPHLLVAGATGSGKSVTLNAMLMSLLMTKTPTQMKLILIDPKRLEFALYADIPHLLHPVVTQPKKVIEGLRWVIFEMDRRYEAMATVNMRNVIEYQKYAHEHGTEYFPYIVVVIDELADLMMTAGKEVESLIIRIAQMARAAGIHLIVATQRPSVDVITGLIKANFPSRIAFRVSSKVDSRTILDCSGADKLLGKGDMLLIESQSSMPRRVHGAYVTQADIESIVTEVRAQQKPMYIDMSVVQYSDLGVDPEDEALYAQVLEFIRDVDEISISLLQRKFRIGYNRSARLIELLELQGRILPSTGSKLRKVIK